MPVVTVAHADRESAMPVQAGKALQNALRSMRRQNSRSRSRRCSTTMYEYEKLNFNFIRGLKAAKE